MEADFLKEAIKAGPWVVLFLLYMMRQEKIEDRRQKTQEEDNKVNRALQQQTTEMLGKSAAYLARAADIIDDFADEKRRTDK